MAQEQLVRHTVQPLGEDSQQEAEGTPAAAAAAESSESPAKPHAHPSPSSPLLDPLAQFTWYHGSIPREEAQYRLEQSGAIDG